MLPAKCSQSPCMKALVMNWYQRQSPGTRPYSKNQASTCSGLPPGASMKAPTLNSSKAQVAQGQWRISLSDSQGSSQNIDRPPGRSRLAKFTEGPLEAGWL